MAPYLQELLEELSEYAPGNTGLRVREFVKDPARPGKVMVDGAGKPIMREFIHYILLTGIYADTPAASKLSLSLGHSAYLGCGRCWVRGIRVGNTIRWYGYVKPVPYMNYAKDEVPGRAPAPKGCVALVGSNTTWRTEREFKAAGESVQRGQYSASQMGTHGVCPFVTPRHTPYTFQSNLFVLPIMHALVYGVVKKFWQLLLAPVEKGKQRAWYQFQDWAKQTMSARAQAVRPTVDQGRPYTDIVKRRGQWTMEEWSAWSDSFSAYIMLPHPEKGGLWPHDRVRQAWQHLREAVVHYVRGPEVISLLGVGGSSTDARIKSFSQCADEAAESMRQFAMLMEKHFPASMCTFNLHAMVCWARQQERVRGACHYETELWVERAIQKCKRTTKFTSPVRPEAVLAGRVMVDMALARARLTSPTLRTFYEFVPEYRDAPFRAAIVDDGDLDGNQLLGAGRVPYRVSHKSSCVASLKTFLRDFGAEFGGWVSHIDRLIENGQKFCFSSQSMETFRYAHVRSEQIVHSLAYDKGVTRESFWVLMVFERVRTTKTGKRNRSGTEAMDTTVEEQRYIAEIQHFVRVRRPVSYGVGPGDDFHHDMPDLRIACCNLYKFKSRPGSGGTVLVVDSLRSPVHAACYVPLQYVHCKLIHCHGDPSARNQRGVDESSAVAKPTSTAGLVVGVNADDASTNAAQCGRGGLHYFVHFHNFLSSEDPGRGMPDGVDQD